MATNKNHKENKQTYLTTENGHKFAVRVLKR